MAVLSEMGKAGGASSIHLVILQGTLSAMSNSYLSSVVSSTEPRDTGYIAV